MKLIKNIIIFTISMIALLFITAFFLPTEITLEREITIDRPVNEVFNHIKYVENMNKVNVWQQKDHNLKKTTTGTDGTVGYTSRWEGNKEVGIGEQEIKKIVENERIDSELRFEKPYKSYSMAYLVTEPIGDNQTKVKWGFESLIPVPMNYMIPNIRKSLKKDFDQGLTNLKNELEQ